MADRNTNMNAKINVNPTTETNKALVDNGDNINTAFGKVNKYLSDTVQSITINNVPQTKDENGNVNLDYSASDTTYTFTNGVNNGTFQVKASNSEQTQEVSIGGLGTAAYTDTNAYATSVQGTKADSAIQGVQFSNGTIITPDANKVIELPNYPTTLPASDVYPWAKAENKPTYTASEVNAVTFVNNTQGLNDTQKANARENIGAGTSNFNGSFGALDNIPTTIAGYGITDAKIENNTITLGNSSKTFVETEANKTLMPNDLIDNNKISTGYIPDYILGQVLYGGTVNASAVATLSNGAKSKLGTTSNTITLTNNATAITGYVDNEGIYYIATANSTFAGLDIVTGDWLISTGSSWTKVDNTDAVKSVNGKTGVITLNSSDIGAVDVSVGVTNVAYNSTNKAITQTINGTTSNVVTVATLKSDMNITASDVGAVRYNTNSQNLTSTQKSNARTNLGLGTSATHNAPTSGNAGDNEVVLGNDTRLSNARTPTAHNQASNTINAMTDYAKASTANAITTTDTLNQAIGKLEKGLDNKLSLTGGTITGALVSSGVQLRPKSTNINRDDTLPSSATTGNGYVRFLDADDEGIGLVRMQWQTSGKMSTQMYALNETEAGAQVDNYISVEVDKTGTRTYVVADAAAFRTAIGSAAQSQLNTSETSNTTPYIYKSSEHDAVYDELVGGSVAWNQLVANSGSSLSVTITSGHKYIMKKSGTLSVGASSGSAITGLTGGADWITDLTLMFGTTVADYAYNLEQSTAGSGIAWLKSYGFFTEDYYAYNAGGLVSVNTSGKKVVGKNLLDDLTTTNPNPTNGITFTVDRELGTVTANGTATISGGGQFRIIISSELVGNYYFSALTSAGGSNYDAYVWCETDGGRAKQWDGVTNCLSDGGQGNCQVRFEAGKTYALNLRVSITASNVVFKPMIRRADVTDPTFEPYTSITYPIQSTDLRGLYKLNGNKLYTDGDIYSADGQITRKYGYRDYQSGDESLANAIADGTHTIYKLSAPTTETAQPFTSPQMVYRNGTEEYLDTRDVPIPVGGNRKYVDIPDWMVNEYFDDVRAEASNVSEIIEKLRRIGATNSSSSTIRTIYAPDGGNGVRTSVSNNRTDIQIACGQASNANARFIATQTGFQGGVGTANQNNPNYLFHDDCIGDKIGRTGSGIYVGIAQPDSTLDLWYETISFNGKVMDMFAHSGQSHNAIWRGKYLGNTFTAAQKAAIADGSFDDLFVGDYWTINRVDWVIVDINYYYGLGDTACWTNHLVIVPRTALGSAQMNPTATTAGGYLNSAMRMTILKCDSTTASDTTTVYGKICAAFGESNILSHRLVFSNAVDANGNASSWEWADSKVDLLNQSQIFGQKAWVNGTNDGYNVGIQSTQLAGFRVNNNFIIIANNPTTRISYWTSDVRTDAFFVNIAGRGNASNTGANNSYGVRPHFCLQGG